MNLLGHLGHFYRLHRQLVDLEDRYDKADDPITRLALAEQAVTLTDAQISHLRASRITRAFTLDSVAVLRVERREWKARARRAQAKLTPRDTGLRLATRTHQTKEK